MQEGLSMPQSHKKRKDGVQEGALSQLDVTGSEAGFIDKSPDG